MSFRLREAKAPCSSAKGVAQATTVFPTGPQKQHSFHKYVSLLPLVFVVTLFPVVGVFVQEVRIAVLTILCVGDLIEIVSDLSSCDFISLFWFKTCCL